MVEVMKSFEEMGMHPTKYLLKYVLPTLVMTLLFVVVMSSMMRRLFFYYPMMRLFVYMIPVIITVLFLAFPIMKREKRKRDINDNMNLFITRMGALATADISPRLLFKSLADAKEYGALTEEIERVYLYMENWNLNLPEACRRVAEKTPSVLFADFLNRMAHSIDAGEEFQVFIQKEQQVVMAEYISMYTSSIKKVETLTELFSSIIVSTLFTTLFTAFLPLFAQVDASTIMMGTTVLFVIMEVMVLVVFRSALPRDELWHTLKKRPDAEKALMKLFWTTLAMAVAIFVFLTLAMPMIPVPLAFSISVSPLMLPGMLIKRLEADMLRSEENYDSLMRAVGASVETVGGTLETAISRIVGGEFGPLSKNVQKLYKRLSTRIDTPKAWQYFAAETGSALITKFTDMYVKGITIGGKPVVIGKIINDNFLKMLLARKERMDAAASLNGVMFGLGIGVALVLSLGMGVMGMMNSIFGNIASPAALSKMGVALPLYMVKFDLQTVQTTIIIMTTTHAIICGLVAKTVSGRHTLSILPTTVPMIWISSICTFMSGYITTLLGK